MNFEIQDAPKGAEERLRKLVSVIKTGKEISYGGNSMRKLELHRQIDGASIVKNIENKWRTNK